MTKFREHWLGAHLNSSLTGLALTSSLRINTLASPTLTYMFKMLQCYNEGSKMLQYYNIGSRMLQYYNEGSKVIQYYNEGSARSVL